MSGKSWVLIAAAFVAASASNASKVPANEHCGVWRLNPSKSKYSPGPGPKELTETIELDERHYKINADGTADDGRPIHIEFNANFDGKNYPMIGVVWADAVAVKWTEDREPQMIQSKNGQVTVTITCRVSVDGKTRTCTLKGKNAEGREVNDLVVFDRR